MSSGLRKHLKQLPYFLLFNYPNKLRTYNELREKNKGIEKNEDKLKLNAYHSPSPMNELCDYICTWEKKNILWDNNTKNLIDTRCLIINNDLDLSDKKIRQVCRRYINQYADLIHNHYKASNKKSASSDTHNNEVNFDVAAEYYKNNLLNELNISEELLANYVISVSYNTISISKSFVWAVFADYIIDNLKNNSNPKRNISITEVPYKTNDSYEYLGKYYEFKEASEYR